jgi:hypothetical protein
MRNRELVRQLQSLRHLIGRTNVTSLEDIELQGHWGRYLCILVAGFIENGLREVYTDYVNRAANPSVASFAARMLNNVQNPRASRFLEIAQAFSSKWAEELDAFLIENERRAAIDGIMSNRHLVAHGKNASISVARVREHLDKCVEVIEFIEAQCLGQNRTHQ